VSRGEVFKQHIATTMPTLSIGNDIVFHYTDSGPIEKIEYSTFVFVHGHTFHTGVFKRILSFASSHSLRVICLSRREYEGSTPYSTDELKAVHQGSDAERADFLHNQGILVALFVDGLIQSLSLPKKGGVTVVGWSLGNVFTIAMRASIDDLPDDTKQRLKAYTRGFIIFDPPSQGLGIPMPSSGVYHPLKDLPKEARGAAFAKWVSSYYKHGDLSSRDFSQLNQHEGDTSKKPTTDTIPLEELLTITDSGPGDNYETFLIESEDFISVLMKQTTKALFDPQIFEDWGEHPVWFVYCENSTWNVHHGAWDLEKKDKASKINFKLVPGANHFLMWDEPERFVSIMKECLSA